VVIVLVFLYYLCAFLVASLVLLSTIFSIWIYVKNDDFVMHDMVSKYVKNEANSKLSVGQVRLLKIVIFLRSTMPYVGVFIVGHKMLILLFSN
jgi:hypothetical protein